MKLKTKNLILGSANFLTRYGESPMYIDKKHSLEILKSAFNHKIKTLDISSDYKAFKGLTKFYNFKKWNICFKIHTADLKKLNNLNSRKKYIKYLFKKLKKNKIKYFLFHNSKDLLSKNGKNLYKYLIEIKNKGLIGKLGVSIYSFKEIKKISKLFKIDILQAPLNILDQRLINSSFINFLKKNKIRLHVRSIFLQGILSDKKLIPKKFSKNKKIKDWYDYIKNNDSTSIVETFNFLNKLKFIDKIIISSRTNSQLIQIINCNIKNSKTNFNAFAYKNLKIIDPRKW